MTEKDSVPPHLSGVPERLRQFVPEDWRPSPMPENCQLHPDTYVTAEIYGQFLAPKMRKYGEARLGRAEGGDDIEQQIALAFLEKFGQTGPTDHTHVGWFYTVGSHKVFDFYRNKERLPESAEIKEDDQTLYNDFAPDPEETLMGKLTADNVTKLLNSGVMSPTEADVVKLFLANPSLTSKEVGELLGTSEGAIRVAKHRGLSKLRLHGEQADLFIVPLKPTEAPPKPSINELRGRMVKAISARYSHTIQQIGAIPLYAGPWYIGARLMRSNFGSSDVTSPYKSTGLVVYPHQERMDLLKAHLSKVLSRTALSAHQGVYSEETPGLIVDTPENILMWPELTKLPITQVVGAAQSIARISRHLGSSYDMPPRMLSLVDGLVPRAPQGNYQVADYQQAGGKRIKWGPNDSTSFVREWILQTDQVPTEEQIDQLHQLGEGPPLRRLCRGIGTFATLLAQAQNP